ncbi:MAG TPA: hypothetical protein PLI15_13120 [Anaerolineales bacterium]|nr:hypothetical protein [Anaerolineales bacterium]HMV98461.1 hypothetical protein [Anaerolineales bacterium]HMX20421.1 hypothetical protein [Anaerolineales bacterium]HMZ43990.1 hypothetical protein [Anaerolineales bacterium]HNB87585.1 hypothetical protein [Anaerolineales bacterium]
MNKAEGRDYSAPKDESLQAFKDWILGIYFNLTGKKTDDMSEEQWVAKWREFWQKQKDKQEKNNN